MMAKIPMNMPRKRIIAMECKNILRIIRTGQKERTTAVAD
jgi:hypothetical protein